MTQRYDGVSIIEYVNSKMADRDRAVELAFNELQRRLDILNHAHEDMRNRDDTFYRKDQHEVFADNLQHQISNLRDELRSEAKPKYVWVGVLATIIAIAGGIWYLSETISRLETNQKAIMNELLKHDELWAHPPATKHK